MATLTAAERALNQEALRKGLEALARNEENQPGWGSGATTAPAIYADPINFIQPIGGLGKNAARGAINYATKGLSMAAPVYKMAGQELGTGAVTKGTTIAAGQTSNQAENALMTLLNALRGVPPKPAVPEAITKIVGSDAIDQGTRFVAPSFGSKVIDKLPTGEIKDVGKLVSWIGQKLGVGGKNLLSKAADTGATKPITTILAANAANMNMSGETPKSSMVPLPPPPLSEDATAKEERDWDKEYAAYLDSFNKKKTPPPSNLYEAETVQKYRLGKFYEEGGNGTKAERDSIAKEKLEQRKDEQFLNQYGVYDPTSKKADIFASVLNAKASGGEVREIHKGIEDQIDQQFESVWPELSNNPDWKPVWDKLNVPASQRKADAKRKWLQLEAKKAKAKLAMGE